jgi:hypothetical protein
LDETGGIFVLLNIYIIMNTTTTTTKPNTVQIMMLVNNMSQSQFAEDDKAAFGRYKAFFNNLVSGNIYDSILVKAGSAKSTKVS